MRPPGPLPATCVMSTPSSRAVRRVEGAAGTSPPPLGTGAPPSTPRRPAGRERRGRCRRPSRRTLASSPGGCSAPASSSCEAAAGSAGLAPGAAWPRACPPPSPASAAFAGWRSAAGAAAAPDSSTVRTSCPTLTLSPVLTFSSLTTPATLDGTSMVALSVSSSSTGWSFFSASPGFTSTRTTSPPATFSPSSGMTKSATRSPSSVADNHDATMTRCHEVNC